MKFDLSYCDNILIDLSKLEKNWDGNNANPFLEVEIEHANNLLNKLKEILDDYHLYINISIVPTPDNDIIFFLTYGLFILEIRVLNWNTLWYNSIYDDGHAYTYIRTIHEKNFKYYLEEEPQPMDLHELKDLLSWLIKQ